jgi:hypothetical protein
MQDIPNIGSESEDEDGSTLAVPLHSCFFLEEMSTDKGSCMVTNSVEVSSSIAGNAQIPSVKDEADDDAKLPAFLKLAEEVWSTTIGRPLHTTLPVVLSFIIDFLSQLQ